MSISMKQNIKFNLVSVNEAVNPLSIDPNERVTPSGHETHNGDMIHCESIGVSEIGVIPPPPMFSSPSPQSGPATARLIIPPPAEHQYHHDQHTKDSVHYSDDEDDEVGDDEPEEEYEDNGRVVATVPAKEPRMDAVPLKSALKKAPGSNRGSATPPSRGNPQTEKNQSSR